ncbi:5-dehydro-2-deoxygluconokinase [Acidaminobacter sp. JC074]|uniref:5-dehydro-2-deoxygluconokinase n=1 Tax=Acidaminobacter sp. JC074 TaxID=2530199 RepID=UPI001F108C79|nr:5-dehydro-2-deoxygluconokinase [Acidaminobacter sp. JC074]
MKTCELVFPEKKAIDIIPIGRIGIDLNANKIHRPLEESETFTKYVGGSPANIAIGMARLGRKVGFIGRVSDDQLGRFALNYFKAEGIDTSGITIDNSGAPMGLAFTEIKSPTESSILMYRDNVADLKLHPKDIKESYIKKAKCILVSGTALSQSPSREAVMKAIEYALKHKVIIIFDIDYRPYSWKHIDNTSVYYSMVAKVSDIIIGSREEFDLCERIVDPDNKDDKVTANRWFDYKAKIVVVKHGKEGSVGYTCDGLEHMVKPFPAKLLKSFGGGDAYASSFIHFLMKGMSVSESLECGSAAAAMLVSSHSCSDAMPSEEMLLSFIKTVKEDES